MSIYSCDNKDHVQILPSPNVHVILRIMCILCCLQLCAWYCRSCAYSAFSICARELVIQSCDTIFCFFFQTFTRHCFAFHTSFFRNAAISAHHKTFQRCRSDRKALAKGSYILHSPPISHQYFYDGWNFQSVATSVQRRKYRGMVQRDFVGK